MYTWFPQIGVEGANKWKVWMDGGIHAREWIAPSTVLYIANQVCNVLDAKYTESGVAGET